MRPSGSITPFTKEAGLPMAEAALGEPRQSHANRNKIAIQVSTFRARYFVENSYLLHFSELKGILFAQLHAVFPIFLLNKKH
jgi:hypothetical protein